MTGCKLDIVGEKAEKPKVEEEVKTAEAELAEPAGTEKAEEKKEE